ncbi:hypothetical protein [Veillonella sp. CHU732]|uniref:hypothetical protein n=1 Tax=Veillonella sp. CHU732 TaxID=2490949 RepID=UPI000F8D85F9|nr:hypothetical protein [Veillonella sp. CHU732]
MKFIVLQRDDIENFIHVKQAQVHDLINEEYHNELAQILDYVKHEEQLQFIKKSSTLLPNAVRLLYIPPLTELGITTGETSVTLEWTGLEEDTLYLIKDDAPLKLRITNPKAGVYYKTIKY